MAVPGRICAGRDGPAESVLLPGTKNTNHEVKSQSDGSRENKRLKFAQRSLEDN
jgi:hypothetical protein